MLAEPNRVLAGSNDFSHFLPGDANPKRTIEIVMMNGKENE
jgi:hypothetical protein